MFHIPKVIKGSRRYPQMESLELENAKSQVKHTLDGVNSRLDSME